MDYVLAALFGLSVGTLIAYGAYPTTRWLPWACTAVVLAIGVGYVTWGPAASPVLGFIIGVASISATILAGGVLWRDHPLLAGSGYWSRVVMALCHTSMLRRSLAERSEQELDRE